MTNIFVKRIDCWLDTQKIADTLIDPSVSIKFVNNSEPMDKRYEKSNITFDDIDCIDLSLQFNNKVLILNLADDCFPGGCVHNGSGAQEESLFRRTNYHKTLLIKYYPLKYNEIIYSPHVTLFKSSEKNNWKLIKPILLNFIACPGIRYPEVVFNEEKNRQELPDDKIEILKIKIETIIQTAYKYNYDTIIFGALGCGAWRNPIEHVAEIFKETLMKYDGVIKNYAFAIMGTNDDTYIKNYRNMADNNNKSTIDIFKQVFSVN